MNSTKAFDTWLIFLDRAEGGKSNHKSDLGKETNRGVTIGTWEILAPKLFNIQGTVETLWNMTHLQWVAICYTYYKDALATKVNLQKLAIVMADTYYHGGFNKCLQRALKAVGQPVVVDGYVGKLTLEALARVVGKGVVAEEALMVALLNARKSYLIALSGKAGQEVNRIGWINRVNNLQNFVNNI